MTIRRPVVSVISTEEVSRDLPARNLSMALALAEADVHVLARRNADHAAFSSVGPVTIEHLAIPDVLASSHDARQRDRDAEISRRVREARRRAATRRARVRLATARTPRSGSRARLVRRAVASARWRAHLLASAVRAVVENASAAVVSTVRGPVQWWDERLGARALRRLPTAISPHLRGCGDLPDCEIAFGRKLDETAPETVWCLDFAALVIALRYRSRARAQGRRVAVIHAGRERAGHSALVDRLSELPDRTVVSAAGAAGAGDPDGAVRARLELPIPLPNLRAAGQKTLREAARVGGGAPVVACVCGQSPDRVPVELIDALPALDPVHCALIIPETKPPPEWARELILRAKRLDCRPRFHVVRAPDPDLLEGYIRDATLGYVAAGASSDTTAAVAAAAFTRAGVPLVVAGHDGAASAGAVRGAATLLRDPAPADVARAIGGVIRDRGRQIGGNGAHGGDPLEWDAQMHAIARVQTELTPSTRAPRRRAPLGGSRAAEDAPVLGIGPRNGNGQAWEWSSAVRRHHEDVRVEVFAVEFPTGSLDMAFDADIRVPLRNWKSVEWQMWWSRYLLNRYSHVLLEQGLAACGRLWGKEFFRELPVLHQHGIEPALVFRGSEIRDPRRHAERERHSPFRDGAHPLTGLLQERVDLMRSFVEEFGGSKFVTTLDLIDDVPDATWLPHVIDLDFWHPGPPVLERERPTVMHAPSREQMKGSQYVDAACERLADAGLISYRRLRGVPYREMPALVRQADIVIDQFAIGSYGVLALQAMAAGRVVVGHVNDHVRARVPDVPLPIVEANGDDLVEVLMELLEDRTRGVRAAEQGPVYARRYHDGRESAARLADFVLPAGDATPTGAVTDGAGEGR